MLKQQLTKFRVRNPKDPTLQACCARENRSWSSVKKSLDRGTAAQNGRDPIPINKRHQSRRSVAHRGCVGWHDVGARHGRRGPAREDASRSVRPEPRSARLSQPWGQPANQPPARALFLPRPRRPRARTGTWTTRRGRGGGALAGRTDWTPPPFPLGAARHGTAPPGCPPHRASPSRRRQPDRISNRIVGAARAGRARVTSGGCGWAQLRKPIKPPAA
jgi:hypothetical protein